VPRDREGFLSVARIVAEQPDLLDADVLICGPPAMIESLRSQLAQAGFPPTQFHAEEFGFAKLGRGGGPPAPAARLMRESGDTFIIPRERRAGASSLALAFGALIFAAGLIVGRHTAPRSQAATPASLPGSASAGKAVFASAGCGACHAFRAAGTHGTVGPDLDRTKPDAARVIDIVANGKGVMPPYEDKLTDEQIRNLGAYVAQAS
jgi:mono/diheme cytochrome c family protein